MNIIRIKHPMEQTGGLRMEPCVLALGVFDGVHKGHQTLVAAAKDIARKKGLVCGVMTFDPHPKAVLFPERRPMKVLTPLAVKAEILQRLGIDALIVVEFDLGFSRLYPENFVKQYLLGLNCRHVVAGFDFRYGYRGLGNMQTLARDAKGRLAVTTLDPVACGREKISSTAIRRLLAAGDVASIPHYLGKPYEVRGKAVHEPFRHQKEQYVKLVVAGEYLLPKPGDYHVELDVDGHVCRGVGRVVHETDRESVLLVQLATAPTDGWRQKKVVVRWLRSCPPALSPADEMNKYMDMEQYVM